MSRRHPALVLAATAAAFGIGVPLAQAEAPTPTARLSGTYSVTGKVTQSVNGEPVGTTWVRPFKFAPLCSSGPCTTRLTRTRGDGQVVTFVLNPTTIGTYEGTTKYKGGCYFDDGTIIAKGFTYTETVRLTQKSVAAGTIKTFAGTMTLITKPTAVGAANDCRAGKMTIALTGRR